MQKTALGCRCSHARETLHAVCPKLLKVPFRAEVSLLATLVLIRQKQSDPALHAKDHFWAAKHAFCMTVLCCPWKGCPWEIQSYPNHAKLDTVFSANVLHSMQRIILASKACLLHECPLLASERVVSSKQYEKKMPNFIR